MSFAALGGTRNALLPGCDHGYPHALIPLGLGRRKLARPQRRRAAVRLRRDAPLGLGSLRGGGLDAPPLPGHDRPMAGGRQPVAAQCDSRVALAGDRGIHVREAIRLEVPIEEVYRAWRRLENLPRFMTHLMRVTETDGRRSHWVAPARPGCGSSGTPRSSTRSRTRRWRWRSLPGSEVVTAGSVNFDRVRAGRSTQVTRPPAVRAAGRPRRRARRRPVRPGPVPDHPRGPAPLQAAARGGRAGPRHRAAARAEPAEVGR